MESVTLPRIVPYEELLGTTNNESTMKKDTAMGATESEMKDQSQENAIIPRGLPKSGKFWKSNRKKASSMVKTRGLRSSWEKKEKLRQDLKRVKEKSRALKQEKIDEKEAKKERRRENLRRQEENRKKSEVVQVIKNPNKMKRMKKKQLRMVEKRDTTTIKK
ncbi:coiled-coil domain-containing protein 86 [Ischnura elegans]|uniref:coiled-coil domain-containing protein 86 n=1 Tax=Ischnura elegans TaxID=197161 RepID=UPI001ED8BA4F|nr:coiled-coil domain-containing protein 86 [Ischnura elegans]